ncbi:MAG: tetrahydromethanopterin S-methyltransferase subunit H [Euryarchaeota archaeon]|nr:tetrahydromethanopterin S-methyltransferase subunit H [Euryarchaeota archaeon]
MFSLKRKQKVVRIGNLKVGGRRGENPTVLIGTMFYNGHRILHSRKKGEFDRKRAEELINRQEELSDATGMPAMLDIVATFGEEVRRYIDFVAEVTDMPFSTDIWTEQPKVEAARYIAEVGLEERHLYNSLAPWAKDPEYEVRELSKLGLKNVLVVAFNMQNPTPRGRVELLRDVLLPRAEKAGFKNVLVDTSLMSIPSAPFSFLASRLVKEEFGLPAGCAPSNGTDLVKKDVEAKWGKLGFVGIDSAAHALGALLWNDFLLYGPIESAPWIFPAMANANAMLATLVYEETAELPGEEHPLCRFYPDFVEELKKGEASLREMEAEG